VIQPTSEAGPNSDIRLSAANTLANLPKILPEGRVTIGVLLEATREHGFVALLLLLASIAMLPVPIWTFLGAAIAILCFNRLVSRNMGSPPAWLLRRSIPRRMVTRACQVTALLLGRLEPTVRRRFPAFRRYLNDRLLTLFSGLMAILLVLPVPVLNWLPCAAILLIALGWFVDDGLCVLLGVTFAVATVAVYAVAFVWLIGFL